MPVPVQSFGNNMMYPDVPSPVIYVPGPPPDSLRAMPFVPPLPPQMYFAVDPLLHANLVSQIDYYFSPPLGDSLCPWSLGDGCSAAFPGFPDVLCGASTTASWLVGGG
nr:RNA-binding protein Lupus La [Tanacetum cinerariifolium]